MAVSKHARDILFFDLSVSRRTQQAPYPPLHEIFELWKKAKETPDFAPKEFESGAVTALIKDCEIDSANDLATLLIEVSDKNAPNTTYLDHEKRTSRHLKKEEPEGNGFSAHIVMSLKSSKENVNTYLTLIEAIPAVSANRIQATLNKVIKEICKVENQNPFTYVPPGGGKKLKNYVPHIVLSGHPSESFYTDIEQGRINSLKLVAPYTTTSLGTGKYLRMDELSLKVSVSRDIPKGQRWDTILTGIAAQKKQFPTARIFLQPESGGKSFHVDINAENGNLIGGAYIKSRRLMNFSQSLDTSVVEKILPHLTVRMKQELIKERDNVSQAILS